MLWLTGEMVKTGVAGADKLCFALLKQLPAGSTTPGEVYITENLMHILLDNRSGKFATNFHVHVHIIDGTCCCNTEGVWQCIYPGSCCLYVETLNVCVTLYFDS